VEHGNLFWSSCEKETVASGAGVPAARPYSPNSAPSRVVVVVVVVVEFAALAVVVVEGAARPGRNWPGPPGSGSTGVDVVEVVVGRRVVVVAGGLVVVVVGGLVELVVGACVEVVLVGATVATSTGDVAVLVEDGSRMRGVVSACG
jgi:hypothetical protein